MEELKTLNNAIHCMKVGADLAVCEDCDLYPCDHSDVKDMAMVAIKTIKKQIPKKVLMTYDDEMKTYWCFCPNCHKGLGWVHTVKSKYCSECGQKLGKL